MTSGETASMIRISAIVNLHNEGQICLPTIESVLRACAVAEKAGFPGEALVVIDKGDKATLEAVAYFGDRIRVETCECGDLAEARNFGVGKARGDMVAFMDGDDLMGSNWLSIAARTVVENPNREVVIHPRVNYYFGPTVDPLYWIHPDMDEDKMDINYLKGANAWTALSFAKTEIYRQHPFRKNEIDKGFGYEDWAWNFETIQAGVTHLAPTGTVHFIRRKESGSLLALSNQRKVIPNLVAVRAGR